MTHQEGDLSGDVAGRPRAISVGLVADPGAATTLAQQLASGTRLAERLDGYSEESVEWRFETDVRHLELDADGNIPVLQIGRAEHKKHAWDFVVVVTDMTRRIDTEPVVADYSQAEQMVLISLPGLGSIRRRQRAEDVLVYLLATHFHGDRNGPRLRGVLQKLVAADEEVHTSFDEHLVLEGVRGGARLLAGMVRANRPWFLVPQLSPAMAAAAAGAAFGVFYSNIWILADSLTTVRLAVVGLLAIVGTAGWLIADNSLWERPARRSLREEAALYNVSTVVTITFAVLCMYVLLYVATVAAPFTVIPSSLMQSTVGHPVDAVDYVRLAWLCVSMGALAGALGSGFAGEDSVRKATYSKRSEERRKQFHEENPADEEG